MAWAQLAGAARKHARASEGALNEAERDRWHRSFLWVSDDKAYLMNFYSKILKNKYISVHLLTIVRTITVSICQFKFFLHISFRHICVFLPASAKTCIRRQHLKRSIGPLTI